MNLYEQFLFFPLYKRLKIWKNIETHVPLFREAVPLFLLSKNFSSEKG